MNKRRKKLNFILTILFSTIERNKLKLFFGKMEMQVFHLNQSLCSETAGERVAY